MKKLILSAAFLFLLLSSCSADETRCLNECDSQLNYCLEHNSNTVGTSDYDTFNENCRNTNRICRQNCLSGNL